MLFIVGATVAGWAPRFLAWWRRFHRYRAYRRLGPLWSAIHDEMPKHRADHTEDRTEAGQTADFLLYRGIIEVRDGTLALRPHVVVPVLGGGGGWGAWPSDGPLPWAASRRRRRRADRRRGGEEAAGASLSPEEREAAVEAATLAAALLARAENRVHATAPAAVRPGPADLDGEARWLVAVSNAYRAVRRGGGRAGPTRSG